jgi:hypothetical protein
MKPIIIVTFACLCWQTTADVTAQTLEDVARGARTGDTVIVTGVDGHRTKAKFLTVSPESIRILTAAPRDVPVDQVVRVERLGDGTGDGFRKGAIVGAIVGAASLVQGGPDMPYGLLVIPTGAIEFGLFGLLFDWMHVARTTLYDAPARKTTIKMVPLVEKGKRGVGLTVGF